MGNIFGLGFSSSFFPPSLSLRSIHSHVFRSSSACHSALYRYLHPLYALNNGGRRRVCATRTRPTNEEKKKSRAKKWKRGKKCKVCRKSQAILSKREFFIFSFGAYFYFYFHFIRLSVEFMRSDEDISTRCMCVCVKFGNVCSSVAIDTSSPPLRPSLYFPFA